MQMSLNLKKDPFVLLLFTAIILLIALALRPVSNMDFQDKVLFGIPLANMVWFIPLFLISLWLVNLKTKKYLYSATATWIHVIATVVSTLLIISVIYIGISPTPDISERHQLVGTTIQVLTLVFVVGQLIYIANVGLGLLKRREA